MKYNAGKPQLDLIPTEQLTQIAEVFGFGADKYGRNNWRHDGSTTSWSETYASIQRHLTAWNDCEDVDPESGFTHLAHAATQIIILMNHAKHVNQDDRFREELTPVDLERAGWPITFGKGVS
jgi:hypothetical protein